MVEKVKVLRIESRRNRGMYQEGLHYKANIVNHYLRHPSPECDEKLDWEGLHYVDRDSVRFGFKDITQLSNWFTKAERKRLYKAGAILKEFEVNLCDVLIGDTQVVFKKKRAKKLREINLGEI